MSGPGSCPRDVGSTEFLLSKMADAQDNEPSNAGPASVQHHGVESEIMQQSVASDCAPSASHHLSEKEPGAVSDDTSPPASSSGEEAPDVDLSSVLERNWDAPAEDLDVLYKPSVTVQSIGVKARGCPGVQFGRYIHRTQETPTLVSKTQIAAPMCASISCQSNLQWFCYSDCLMLVQFDMKQVSFESKANTICTIVCIGTAV